MNQNKLFHLTRINLALWYAVVMGLILSISAFGFYRAVFHAHVVALDNEIESVAGTLHDTLEAKLQQPGKLEPAVQRLFSDISLCQNKGAKCIQQKSNKQRHFLGITNHDNYYIRFFDLSGHLVATAGNYPAGISTVFSNQKWQFIKDEQNNDYHQITIKLHIPNNGYWGYIQVGRSLEDFNRYLESVKLFLALGLLITMSAIALASWGLSGLAMRPIYQSYRQIQQFTADAAHELRTPLASTRATIESALLIPQIEEEDTRDVLKALHRQNQRLTTLVTDLLMLARLDREAISSQQDICCLDDIVSDLIEEFAAMAASEEITLTYSTQVNQPLNIIGNADHIYRLISNLIVNGINYTLKGGEVKIVLNRNENYAVVMVQDTGIGIPQNELARIFDRFYRVSSDRSRSTGGSGLGLAIVQAIVGTHKGKLNVESELGKGTTFTVQLPLDIAPLKSQRSVFGLKGLYRSFSKPK